MERSWRTLPRLSKTILNLTKGATDIVYAASCNNTATHLTNFYLPLLVPVAGVVNGWFDASRHFVPDVMFECSVRLGYCTK